MNTSKLKIIAFVTGTPITAGYIAGSQNLYIVIEIAKIEASSRIKVVKIDVNGQIDRMIVKAELNKIVKDETNKVISNNSETINFPLELKELKDLIINFDFNSLPFKTLVGITLFAGTLTSLICILFLNIYIFIYKLDLSLKNYYSLYA
jgi:hypothetical protein